MDQMEPDKIDEELQETPEDVAVLYSWAKLQGAKYRDFSASRREYRAQMRHRAAESQREAERKAQAEAENAAAAAEKAAREAEEAARVHEQAAKIASRRGDSSVEEAASAKAMKEAAELARKASADRLEAARRAEAVAAAEAAARREEREMAEAHASAQRQAQQYQESEMRRRAAAGPQPTVAGEISDPYTMDKSSIRPDRVYHHPVVVPQDDMQPARYRQSRERNAYVPPTEPVYNDAPDYDDDGLDPARRASDKPHPLRRASDKKPPTSIPAFVTPQAELVGLDEPKFEEPDGRFPEPQFSDLPQSLPIAPRAMGSRAEREAYAARVSRRGASSTKRPAAPYRTYESESGERPAADTRPAYEEPVERRPRSTNSLVPDDLPEPRVEARAEPRPRQDSRPAIRPAVRMQETETDDVVPAWINNPKPKAQAPAPVATAPAPKRTPVAASPVEDTLQHSRERVASRWFALKGVFDQSAQDPQQEAAPQRAAASRVPLLTVFSLAGGVGKTSLVATLGRALSSVGERVLLTDTTSHGLLPFYFGASELRPGAVRTFTPPEGSPDAPISLVSYDVNEKVGDAESQEWLAEELTKNGKNMQRLLVDLTPSGAWMARKLARMGSVFVVPVAPDMNSVISLQGVEKFFSTLVDGEGHAVEPFYLLNQFDAALPLHLDVREVMRQQLGDRLLPFAIRRSPSVSEALAEGMTVMDYAPDSTVASDYGNLVSWVRAQAPVVTGLKKARWSER